MKKYSCELVKEFDGSYYLNLTINNELVRDLPEYVNYKTLKKAVKDQYSINLPKVSSLEFKKIGRKEFSDIEIIIN